MRNTIQITPFMHVRDLEPAVAFLEDVLGFEIVLRIGRDYAYLEREGRGSGCSLIPMRISSRAGGNGSLIISTFGTWMPCMPS
jgi:catechol 2,3-dioxygenase-like lactoylglutathione lyase family enzyme